MPEPGLPRYLPAPVRLPRTASLLQQRVHGQGAGDRREPRGAHGMATQAGDAQKRLDYQERVGESSQAEDPIQWATNGHYYEAGMTCL